MLWTSKYFSSFCFGPLLKVYSLLQAFGIIKILLNYNSIFSLKISIFLSNISKFGKSYFLCPSKTTFSGILVKKTIERQNYPPRS